MGSFPQLRKKLHNHLTIFPPENIFTSHTIMDHYAFHYGGRKELQFNIGFIEHEGEEKFRYGVALSFEENKTLPNFRVLEKQFIRFNEYIKVNKSKLTDYKLYYHDDIRDERFFISIDEVNAALFRAETFIFLGKIISPNKIEYEISLKKPAMLFFNEIFYPGWKLIDEEGNINPVIRINYAFRGTYLDEGHYKLIMCFSP